MTRESSVQKFSELMRGKELVVAPVALAKKVAAQPQ